MGHVAKPVTCDAGSGRGLEAGLGGACNPACVLGSDFAVVGATEWASFPYLFAMIGDSISL